MSNPRHCPPGQLGLVDLLGQLRDLRRRLTERARHRPIPRPQQLGVQRLRLDPRVRVNTQLTEPRRHEVLRTGRPVRVDLRRLTDRPALVVQLGTTDQMGRVDPRSIDLRQGSVGVPSHLGVHVTGARLLLVALGGVVEQPLDDLLAHLVDGPLWCRDRRCLLVDLLAEKPHPLGDVIVARLQDRVLRLRRHVPLGVVVDQVMHGERRLERLAPRPSPHRTTRPWRIVRRARSLPDRCRQAFTMSG